MAVETKNLLFLWLIVKAEAMFVNRYLPYRPLSSYQERRGKQIIMHHFFVVTKTKRRAKIKKIRRP